MTVAESEYESFYSYSLYNEEIHSFFMNSYISKKVYSKGEALNRPRQNAVFYIAKGYARTYVVNLNGYERFNGFTPTYSTIFYSPKAPELNRRAVAVTTLEIYHAALSEYLEFLSHSPQLMLHQITEGTYRRNINDLPLWESQNQSANAKIYIYLQHLAIRFGKKNTENPDTIVIANAPTLKDIAHYNNIHPNNAITYFNELKHKGIVSKEKDKLIIHDISRLIQEIEFLMK